jgi:hypothetical protein
MASEYFPITMSCSVSEAGGSRPVSAKGTPRRSRSVGVVEGGGGDVVGDDR